MAAYFRIDDCKNKLSGEAAKANTKLSGMAAYLNMGDCKNTLSGEAAEAISRI